jgi:hypothetical protein
MKSTREELAETQTDRVVEATIDLRNAAKLYAANPNEWNERDLVKRALHLARRVRRIAGVR